MTDRIAMGRSVDIAINHDPAAIAIRRVNDLYAGKSARMAKRLLGAGGRAEKEPQGGLHEQLYGPQ